MNEIVPGIYRITQHSSAPMLKPPANIYVIAGKDSLIVDAGYGTRRAEDKLLRELAAVGADMEKKGEEFAIDRAILTHSHGDHFSGLKHLRQKTGVRIVLTRQMAEHIRSIKAYHSAYKGQPSPVQLRRPVHIRMLDSVIDTFYAGYFGLSFISDPDVILDVPSTITAGGRTFQVMGIPGHCDDHIALYDAESGVLFAGDHILRSVTTWLGPPRSDLTHYCESLTRMMELPGLKLILTSHGRPITQPVARIRDVLRHREARTRQVAKILRSAFPRGVTFSEIVSAVYPDSGRFLRWSAEGWILTTLEFFYFNEFIGMLHKKTGPEFVWVAGDLPHAFLHPMNMMPASIPR